MFRALERAAARAAFGILCAALLAACGSRDRLAERKLEAERRAGLDEPVLEDDFFTAESETGDEDAGADAARPQGGLDDEDAAMAALEDDGGLEGTEAPPGRDTRSAPPAGAEGRAGEVLRSMREDREVNEETARWWARKGDEAFDESRFQEAAEAYRNSLDLVPDQERVRERWNLALTLLDRRQGELERLPEVEFDRQRVETDQKSLEIRRNLDEASTLFAEGEIDRAERRVRIALGMIETYPDLVVEGQRKEARELLREIEARKAEIAEEKRKEQIREAEEQAQEEIAEEQRRQKEQVQDLLHKARRHIRLRDYRKAREACEAVLEIEPENRLAQFWRQVSDDQLENHRRLTLLKDRKRSRDVAERLWVDKLTPHEDIQFPPDDDWQEVMQRSRNLHTVTFEEPESVRRIKNRLESEVIGNINFDDTPLSQVLQVFQRITGVNIIPDPSIDVEAPEFHVTQPITNLSAMQALGLILESKGLGYTFQENNLVVSSADDIQLDTEFEVYNVSDLLTKIKDFEAPKILLRGAGETQGEQQISFTEETIEEGETLAPEDLIDLIKETTGGEEQAWVEETSIQHSRGQLFVDAPADLHVKVQGVLDSLRQDSDLFVVIEARFIDVFDDFLEDIGIDSRSLGLVNNLGTPFGNVINDNTTGGNDLGIVEDGSQDDVALVQGLERWAGRVQHIIDGFSGTIRGERLTAGDGLGGATFQATWLEPFQVNVILRMVQEKQDVRQLTAPVVTAHNNERVYVSVITQRAYIADYELVSGGTGFAIIEVADPVVQTFQEGVILDVDPTISHDKRYVTLDVRPTLASLIGGVISTINISLGSFTNVAFQVPIGIPQIALQQSFTSVTVPNGGTVLLGGFKSMDDGRFESYLPILGRIPVLKNLARRQATITEKRSLVILLSARIVDLRGREARMFNEE